MEICIFGAGSLGSALGGILSRRNEVTLIGRRQNMSAIREHGLKLVGDIEDLVHVGCRESGRGMTPPELILVSTKAYDTENAVKSCMSFADDHTMVLTLQNGLGNLEILRNWRRAKAFGGTTTMGANLVSPGVVKVSGLGHTVIGSDLDGASASRIASAFNSCGMRTKRDPRIFEAIWSKAVVNACINPIAAVLRVPNGKLIESAVISRLMRDVGTECDLVARSSGVRMRPGSSYARARAVCNDTRYNMSSMLQDVVRGRRTEIGQINGAMCSIGDKHGIRTPLNDALVAMISSLPPNPHRRKVNI